VCLANVCLFCYFHHSEDQRTDAFLSFLCVRLVPLAYLTAKTHGMNDIADEILESSGLSQEDVADLPTHGTLLVPPRPLMRVHDSNWPQLAVSRSYFEGVFTGDMEGVAPQVPPTAAEAEPQADQWGLDDEFSIPSLDHKGASLAPIMNDALDADGDGGWDMDADLAAELHAETGAIVAEDSGLTIPVAGQSEAEIWCQNSPLAADHVAAGAFESAMQVAYCGILERDAHILCLVAAVL